MAAILLVREDFRGQKCPLKDDKRDGDQEELVCEHVHHVRHLRVKSRDKVAGLLWDLKHRGREEEAVEKEPEERASLPLELRPRRAVALPNH